MQTVIQLQAVHALPCLTAIEAALTEPFEFHVRSDLHLKSFRAETPGAWITRISTPPPKPRYVT